VPLPATSSDVKVNLDACATALNVNMKQVMTAASRRCSGPDERADAYALARSAQAKRNEIVAKKVEADAKVNRIRGELDRVYPPRTVAAIESDPALVAAIAERDSLVSEFHRADARSSAFADKAQALGALVQNNISRYLRETVAELVDVDPPAIKKGDTLDAVRARIETLRKKLKEAAGAPVTSAEAKG
jgi:hypothetical protein